MSSDCCLLGSNDIEVLFLPRVTSRVTAKVVTNLLIFMWNVEHIKCMQELPKVDGNTSKLVTCPTSTCCVAHIRIGRATSGSSVRCWASQHLELLEAGHYC